MPKDKEPAEHLDIAIGEHGETLPYSPKQVRGIVAHSLKIGNIICAVIEMEDGNLAIQVLGEPSLKIAEKLEQAAKAYRIALKGH